MSVYGGLRLLSALALGWVFTLTAQAEAQVTQAVAAQAVNLPPPALPLYDDRQAPPDPNPMAPVGIGVKLGLAGIGAGDLKLQHGGKSFTGHTDSRRGMHIALPLSFGGAGFGWLIEPYMTRATVNRTTRDASGLPNGTADSNLTAYGLYTGPMVNLQVARPLYLGVGLGVKAAYVTSPDFRLALDAYGRVPVNATYYLSNTLALVAELGLGYGLSVYADKPTAQVNSTTGKISGVHDDSQLGKAFAWDCSLGFRLP